ncbi:SRPBCC family protein [Nonomuraea sp. NPDC051941]|uniref:SRPBCC family protein n=1 Tax=Nonomuraea sp. NPDC051941 TaxID=3364373 RepID=UPI0037CC0C77
MILDNEITVPAPPDEVFALISDVERVVTCLPGAALDGRDGDAYQGGVTVKVGPVTAAYTGTVRFLEVDAGRRLLRLQGRGADTHGGGDAEAEVVLTVEEAPTGSLLRVRTDLLIRGKIVQFGKGAIATVSGRLLQQFAANLATLVGAPAPSAAPVSARPAPRELDGLAMLLPPGALKYAAVAAAFVAGLVQGWLLCKVRRQAKLIKELRRG